MIAAGSRTVVCDSCGEEHEAVFSHTDPTTDTTRRIYAAVCPVDDVTEFYREDRLS